MPRLYALLIWISVIAYLPAQTITGLSLDLNTTQFSIHDLSSVTGLATNSRTSGQTGFMIGLAYRPQDGFLYGMTGNSGTLSNRLLRIDPVTGSATAIGPHGLQGLSEGGLAVDPTTGILYGLYTREIPITFRHMFQFNLTTGVATVTADFTGLSTAYSSNDLSAMAFDSTGQMYVLDDFNAEPNSPNAVLYRINKATGAVQSTVTLDRRLSQALGMVIDPSTGTFYVGDSNIVNGYAGTNSLYTLDPTTGTTTLIGNMGLTTPLMDMTVITAVPEPILVVPAVLLVSGFFLYRWRRKFCEANAEINLE